MARQHIKVRNDLHKSLSNLKSDTGVTIPIGAAADEAVEAFLKRRKLNALIMKAYRAPTLEAVRLVLKEEVGEFLGIPDDYLFAD